MLAPRPFVAGSAAPKAALIRPSRELHKSAACRRPLRSRQTNATRASFGTSFKSPYHDELIATANYISQRGRGILGEAMQHLTPVT